MLVRCGAVRVEGGNGELVGAGFQQGKPLIQAQAAHYSHLETFLMHASKHAASAEQA